MPVPLTREEAVSVKQLCERAGIPCRAFGYNVSFKMIARLIARIISSIWLMTGLSPESAEN